MVGNRPQARGIPRVVPRHDLDVGSGGPGEGFPRRRQVARGLVVQRGVASQEPGWKVGARSRWEEGQRNKAIEGHGRTSYGAHPTRPDYRAARVALLEASSLHNQMVAAAPGHAARVAHPLLHQPEEPCTPRER